MKRFTNSVRRSIEQRNWYGALTTALILPDICGRLSNPKQASGARYALWFDQWMTHNYLRHLGPEQTRHTFLSGSDCYALRCSLLHQGEVDITGQKAQAIRNALDNFLFISPEVGPFHCLQINNMLQLRVDVFSLEMADAVDAWEDSVKEDQDIQQRSENLLVIHNMSKGVRLSLVDGKPRAI